MMKRHKLNCFPLYILYVILEMLNINFYQKIMGVLLEIFCTWIFAPLLLMGIYKSVLLRNCNIMFECWPKSFFRLPSPLPFPFLPHWPIHGILKVHHAKSSAVSGGHVYKWSQGPFTLGTKAL